MTKTVPDVTLVFRENGEFVTKTTEDLFAGKKVIIFGLPGAFTPTCSSFQLPGYEENFEKFKAYGVEEIYCISVNDPFVMNAWSNDQGIEKVKMIPDGNGDFTDGMEMLVEKANLGFGFRSWRYSALVDNKQIFKLFEEDGIDDNIETDPYAVSDPHTMLHYLSELTGIPVPQ